MSRPTYLVKLNRMVREVAYVTVPDGNDHGGAAALAVERVPPGAWTVESVMPVITELVVELEDEPGPGVSKRTRRKR